MTHTSGHRVEKAALTGKATSGPIHSIDVQQPHHFPPTELISRTHIRFLQRDRYTEWYARFGNQTGAPVGEDSICDSWLKVAVFRVQPGGGWKSGTGLRLSSFGINFQIWHTIFNCTGGMLDTVLVNQHCTILDPAIIISPLLPSEHNPLSQRPCSTGTTPILSIKSPLTLQPPQEHCAADAA